MQFFLLRPEQPENIKPGLSGTWYMQKINIRPDILLPTWTFSTGAVSEWAAVCIDSPITPPFHAMSYILAMGFN